MRYRYNEDVVWPQHQKGVVGPWMGVPMLNVNLRKYQRCMCFSITFLHVIYIFKKGYVTCHF